MGNCCGQEQSDGQHDAIGENASLQGSEQLAPVELPAGWKAVPSRSRPGKVAYQNIHTGERISWVPTEEAKTFKGGINKKKKKTSAGKKKEENGENGTLKSETPKTETPSTTEVTAQ